MKITTSIRLDSKLKKGINAIGNGHTNITVSVTSAYPDWYSDEIKEESTKAMANKNKKLYPSAQVLFDELQRNK